MAFRTGYYGTLVALWGMLALAGLGLGAVVARLAF